MLPLRAREDLEAMTMKGLLRIPQSSSIIGASPSDCLVSYSGGGVLPFRRDAVNVFWSPSWQGSRWWSLTPLRRYSRCILPSWPTGTMIASNEFNWNRKKNLKRLYFGRSFKCHYICWCCWFRTLWVIQTSIFLEFILYFFLKYYIILL